MKKIITHINPDLDAIASVWLLKRFLLASPSNRGEPGWQEAEIDFCPAQNTIDGQPVDSNPNILHVDVGGGKLDHHQTNEYLSAAKLCFDFIKESRKGQELSPLDLQALEKIVAFVTEVDNAVDLSWPEFQTEKYDFYLHNILSGLRGIGDDDSSVMNYGLKSLDTVFYNLKGRIRAEEELKKGQEFQTSWGKAIGIETGNEFVIREGERKGYCLVIRRDPDKGGIRIYASPVSKVNLQKAYETLKEKDKEGEWFLHSSGKILLNESRTREMKPTKITLKEIMEVLKLG
ncbi:MAG: hypothetical protein NT052_00395 [Candidatus Shapirobacteria bacterium]|nr:hypothetical protein [Candidatus Shapirobacteria bacterium]